MRGLFRSSSLVVGRAVFVEPLSTSSFVAEWRGRSGRSRRSVAANADRCSRKPLNFAVLLRSLFPPDSFFFVRRVRRHKTIRPLPTPALRRRRRAAS